MLLPFALSLSKGPVTHLDFDRLSPNGSLNPRMRVFDILEEGLTTLHPGMYATARRSRLEKLTDQVGLRKEALERFPHEFSGGQRQRISIAHACALAVRPKLIVCDEPTSTLDVSVQAQILNLLEAVLQRPQHAYTRTLLAAVPRLAAAADAL